MKKLILVSLVGGIVFLQGCAGVSMGWEPIDPKVGIPVGNGNHVFRNIVHFENKTLYCSVTVTAGQVNQPVHKKTRFNPVKKSFTLHKGGDEHFIEYNFNTNNPPLTEIFWYDRYGNYLNTEKISYNPVREHMGEQYVNLTNHGRKECWEKNDGDVNINVYNQRF